MTFNSYGYFEYGPTSAEILRLRREVEDMEDDSLLEEVMDSPFRNEEVEALVARVLFTGEELTEAEREKLIGYYILLHCEEDVDLERGEEVGFDE